MKQKLLFLLTALMLLVTGNAWGDATHLTTMTGQLGPSDNSAPWWTYYSKTATIKKGETYTYTFTNYDLQDINDETASWILEIRDQSTAYCFDARGNSDKSGDNAGWKWDNGTNALTYDYSGKVWSELYGNASDFKAAYNGVVVTLTITRSADGGTVTVTRSATLNDSKDFSGTWTCYGFTNADNMTIDLAALYAHQNITKVVNTNASGVSTMYKTVDLSQFDANCTYSDGTASFHLSGSQWSKLDLSSYYNDIAGIITGVRIKFTENIGTGGRMCFGIFGNNKTTWNNGMPETANSVSTWGVCAKPGSTNLNRVYYSSKPSFVGTLTAGSSQAIEIDMDMVNKSFSFIQGSTALVNNQPFIDSYITSPKYFAGHTWTDETNTTTLSNMTIEIVYRDASYFTAECKTYEPSSAFATYIDGLYDAGSLKTVDDVYAAYSQWQIAQAVENRSIDYTKVLYNADFSLGTKSGWTISGDANAGGSDDDKYGNTQSNGSGGYQYYTGWNGRNVSQTIAGLPAGKYRLTAKVYSWSGGAPVRLFANGVLSDQEDGENHTPTLDFTVTGNESSIKIGIGGVGNNNDTDKTWGTWGYQVDYFTLELVSVPATIGANGFATFASEYPLDMTIENMPDGVRAFTASITGNTVSFTKLNQTVPANTGVLLASTDAMKGQTVQIPVVAIGDPVENNRFIAGTGEELPADDFNYYFALNKNRLDLTFGKFDQTNVIINTDKAYFTVSKGVFGSGAARLTLRFDDTTAINAIEAAEVEDGALKDGKYIIDNKIVIVKNGVKYGANGQKLN